MLSTVNDVTVAAARLREGGVPEREIVRTLLLLCPDGIDNVTFNMCGFEHGAVDAHITSLTRERDALRSTFSSAGSRWELSL